MLDKSNEPKSCIEEDEMHNPKYDNKAKAKGLSSSKEVLPNLKEKEDQLNKDFENLRIEK